MAKAQKSTVFKQLKKPTKKTPSKKPEAMAPEIVPGQSKQAQLIALLNRSVGGTLEEMVQVTGWQRHSVRGAISGALKKRLGLQVTTSKEDRGLVYRIVGSR